MALLSVKMHCKPVEPRETIILQIRSAKSYSLPFITPELDFSLDNSSPEKLVKIGNTWLIAESNSAPEASVGLFLQAQQIIIQC